MLKRQIHWLGILLAFALASGAAATVVDLSKMETLVEKADAIVEGDVEAVESKVVGGHIETTIQVKMTKKYKGALKGDRLTLTQLGGAVKKPVPLAQAVPGLAAFKPQESVVLFLSTRPAIPVAARERALASNEPLPALWTSPQVIGGFQGKYNIYLDPKTQKKVVSRQSARTIQSVDTRDTPAAVRRQIEKASEALESESTASSPAAAAPASGVAYEEFTQTLQSLIKAQAEAQAAQAAAGAEPPAPAPAAEEKKAPAAPQEP